MKKKKVWESYLLSKQKVYMLIWINHQSCQIVQYHYYRVNCKVHIDFTPHMWIRKWCFLYYMHNTRTSFSLSSRQPQSHVPSTVIYNYIYSLIITLRCWQKCNSLVVVSWMHYSLILHCHFINFSLINYHVSVHKNKNKNKV